MELLKLSLEIPSYEPIDDGATYNYNISVKYKSIPWTISRRFSDFDQLYSDLVCGGYASLPRLPRKTLFGSPTDVAVVESRRKVLQMFIHELVSRPDTRTAPEVLDFLQFVEHTNMQIESIQIQEVGNISCGRMAITSLYYSAKRKLLFTGQEDNTNLCRLGKVWSLVESENIGCLSVLSHSSAHPTAFTHVSDTSFPQKCRAVTYDEANSKILVGQDDGHITSYNLSDDTFVPVIKNRMYIHGGAVVCLSRSGDYILSLGFDDSIRLIQVNTVSVVSGGLIHKRLEKNEKCISCRLLSHCKMFKGLIGTSKGRILIYKVESNPPVFEQLINVESGTPVAAIAYADGNLFIGHGETVSCWRYNISEGYVKISKRGMLTSTLSVGRNVSALACHIHTKRLIAGYQIGAVLIWCLELGRCLVGYQAHAQAISCILVAPEFPDMYFTGSDDGCVKVWEVPADSSKLEWWSVCASDAAIENTRTNGNINKTTSEKDTNNGSNDDENSKFKGYVDNDRDDMSTRKTGNDNRARFNPFMSVEDHEEDFEVAHDSARSVDVGGNGNINNESSYMDNPKSHDQCTSTTNNKTAGNSTGIDNTVSYSANTSMLTKGTNITGVRREMKLEGSNNSSNTQEVVVVANMGRTLAAAAVNGNCSENGTFNGNSSSNCSSNNHIVKPFLPTHDDDENDDDSLVSAFL